MLLWNGWYAFRVNALNKYNVDIISAGYVTTTGLEQHSSFILPVWLNGWVFDYIPSGCGFKFPCRNLNFAMFGYFVWPDALLYLNFFALLSVISLNFYTSLLRLFLQDIFKVIWEFLALRFHKISEKLLKWKSLSTSIAMLFFPYKLFFLRKKNIYIQYTSIFFLVEYQHLFTTITHFSIIFY